MRPLLAVLSCASDGPKPPPEPEPTTTESPAPDPDTAAPVDSAGSPTGDTGTAPEPVCGTLLSVEAIGGAGWQSTQILAASSDGATYAGGYFSGELTLHPGGSDEVTLVPTGLSDALVVRYEPDGTIGWAAHLASTYAAAPEALAASPAGGVVVVGSFYDSLTLAAGTPEEVTLLGAGGADGFVAAYDAGGTLLWAAAVASADDEYVQGAGVLADGDVLVVGQYEGDTWFGAELLAMPTSAVTAGFVARVGSDGTWQWAQRFSGTYAYAAGAALDPVTQDLVLTGLVSGPGVAEFGDPPTIQIELSADSADAVVARYSADGSVQWVARGTSRAWGNSVDIAPDGTALVVGGFFETATFGVGEPTETALTTSAFTDLWVARYGADGALLWVRASQSPPGTNTEGRGIAAAADGGAVVIGDFTDAVLLGEGTATETTFHTVGSYNPVVARYDADGDLTCAVQVEVSDYGIGIDAARAADGSFVTTGDFDGDARFGAGGPVLSTVGEGDDGYLATWAF